MRDEFVDTCGLCDAPLRMGQRCACGDNWRAAQPAPAQSAALARKCRRPDGCDDEWRCSMNTPETAPCGARMEPVDLAQPASAEPAGPVAWREHVEQRIRSWRQSTLTRSGDRLAIDDYMGADDIDDLVDYVCDERADPAAPSALHEAARMAMLYAIDVLSNAEIALPPVDARDGETVTHEHIDRAIDALRAAIGEQPCA